MTAAAAPLPVVELHGIGKVYTQGELVFEALRGVSLTILQGEMVALMGPSGSGKTTLMQVIGLLDRPSSGSYHLAGRDVTTLNENDLARARNEDIGFVFQAFHLLARQTLLENVEVPLVYAGVPPRERRARALDLLERVGLADKAGSRPSQISGGQKQRVAVARALAGSPRLLLADEPTGNLDTRTSEEVMALFCALHAEGTTVVIVTHEADIGAYAERVVRVRDGLIESDRQQTPRRPGGVMPQPALQATPQLGGDA